MKHKIKEAPGNACELHKVLYTVAEGKGDLKP